MALNLTPLERIGFVHLVAERLGVRVVSARCLLAVLSHPDGDLPKEQVVAMIGSTCIPKSVEVYFCHLTRALADVGLPRVKYSRYSNGYALSQGAGRKVFAALTEGLRA